MNRVDYRILATIVFGMIVMTSCYAGDNSSSGKPIAGVADLQLKSDDIPRMASDALNGSRNAALRLSEYYGSVKLDRVRQMYWERIGAENGNPTSMYNYAVSLSESGEFEGKLHPPSQDDLLRARFWAKKAADAGVEPAKKFLIEHPMKEGG